MPHKNIDDRRIAVTEMIKQEYSTKDISTLAKKYDCSYTSVYMDVAFIKHDNPASMFSAKKLKEQVKIRDSFTCQYCGIALDNMVVDHVIPFIIGGVGRDYNLVCSCNSCNGVKRSSVWIPRNIEVLAAINKSWAENIIRLSTERKRKLYSNKYATAYILSRDLPFKNHNAYKIKTILINKYKLSLYYRKPKRILYNSCWLKLLFI